MQAARDVMNGARMMVPDCPPLLQMIMKKCWEQEPKNRPEFKEILEMILESEGEQDDNRNVVVSPSNQKIYNNANDAEYMITEGNSNYQVV